MSVYDHEAEGWDEWDDAQIEADRLEYLAYLNQLAHEEASLDEDGPVKCVACEYLFAVVGELCQYCEAQVVGNASDVLVGFEKLLTNHLAFARWEAERARPAQAA